MSLWQTFKHFFSKWFYQSPQPSTLLTQSTSYVPPLTSQDSNRYQIKYVEHLQHLYRNVKGYSIPRSITPTLEEIFVEPELTLFSTEIETTENGHADHSDINRAGIWQWLEKSNTLWVTGRPGSGKTSLLLYIILTSNKRLSEKLTVEKELVNDKLPILLYLRNHRQEINDNPAYTLAQAIHNALMIQQINHPVPANWFAEQLKKGRCLIMMDGLDEVPDTQRKRVVSWIEQQMETYRHNNFIVTSRLLDLTLLNNITVLQIEPFTNEQVALFVKRWYSVYERQANRTDITAQKQMDKLMALLSESTHTELASNPLLLTMMVSYYCHPERDLHSPNSSKLPSRRAELYAKVCEISLNGNKREGETHKISVKQKLRLLQPLAYQMMKHHRSSLHLDEASKVLYVPLDLTAGKPNVADFLHEIEQQSGLLRRDGEYAFAQRTFQEYMTALYIADTGLEKELMNAVRFEDSWWNETTYFYSTYTDVTPIMIAFLRHEKLSLRMLRLAVNCMQEPNEVELEVQNRWEKRLKENVEDPLPVRRHLVAQGLLSLRLKHMLPVDEERYVADSLVTNAEYQLFRAQQAPERAQTYHSHLPEGRFATDDGLKPVSDIGPDDAVAFCEWLTKRDKEGWQYRLPYLAEFSPLLSEIAYWVFDKTENVYKKENESNQVASFSLLEEQLRLSLAHDLACKASQAREKILSFSYELEQIDTPNRALTLATTFTYERAHYYATNSDSSSTTSPSHQIEHTRMAKLVVERLFRVLRQGLGHSYSSKKISNQPLSNKFERSTATLAEQYFTLHRHLQHLQMQINYEPSKSVGLRLVAYRSQKNSLRKAAQQNQLRQTNITRSTSSKAKQQAKQTTESQFVGANRRARVIQKKICILGNPNVGKTSLLRRFVEGHFDERYLSTVGVNILRKTLERPTCTMNMVLWEIEGGQGFKKAHIEYLHGIAGALIVCDLTRSDTLTGVEQYITQLRALNAASYIIIVGNKVDLTQKRAITYEQLNAISQKLDCPYILASAKTGTQVDDAFGLLADQIEKASL